MNTNKLTLRFSAQWPTALINRHEANDLSQQPSTPAPTQPSTPAPTQPRLPTVAPLRTPRQRAQGSQLRVNGPKPTRIKQLSRESLRNRNPQGVAPGLTFSETKEKFKEGAKSLASLPRQIAKDMGLKPKQSSRRPQSHRPPLDQTPDQKQQLPDQKQQLPTEPERPDDNEAVKQEWHTKGDLQEHKSQQNQLFRQQRRLDKARHESEIRQLQNKVRASQSSTTGLKNMFPQRGLVNSGLRIFGGRAGNKIRKEISEKQNAFELDQLNKREKHLNRMGNLSVTPKPKQDDAPDDAPDQASHGYTKDEVKVLKNAGFTEGSINELWRQENQKDIRNFVSTKVEKPKAEEPKAEEPKARGQKQKLPTRQSLPDVAPGQQLPNPESLENKAFDEAIEKDKTGWGHDEQLSQFDDQFENLMPDDANRIRDNATKAFEEYQKTGDESLALKAAANARQLKIHGYGSDIPHSQAGVIEKREAVLKKAQQLKYARQWHEYARGDQNDQHAQNAKKQLEAYFQKDGIDIKEQVLKAIRRSKSRGLQADLREYQDLMQTKARVPGMWKINEKIERAREGFAKKNIDIDKLIKSQSKSYLDKNPVRKAYWEDKWAKQRGGPPRPATSLPEMEHSAGSTKEQQQEAESLRGRMVQAATQRLNDDIAQENDPGISAQQKELGNKTEREWGGGPNDPKDEAAREKFKEQLTGKFSKREPEANPSDDSSSDWQDAENEFWGPPQESSSDSQDEIRAKIGQKAKIGSRKNDPLGFWINELMGDDAAIHHIVREQVDTVKETDLDQDRKEALLGAVENIVGAKNVKRFMRRVNKVEDQDTHFINKRGEKKFALPELDLILQSLKSSGKLAVAFPKSSQMSNMSEGDMLLQSLQDGFGKPNHGKQWVEKAIKSLGGVNKVFGLLDYYKDEDEEEPEDQYPNDDSVPFMSNGDIIRFSNEWSDQMTRRELNLAHDVTVINRYAMNPLDVDRGPDLLAMRFSAHWELNRSICSATNNRRS